MRTIQALRSSAPASLAAALTLALPLTATVLAPTGAAAATRTTVSGWSTTPATVAPATEVRRSVTVLTGGRAVERRAVLQFRPGGTLTWQFLTAARTDPRGVATLAGTPSAFEAEVLRLTNELRARGATCGSRSFAPQPPLRSSATLTLTARDYAARMGREGFFAHVSPDGDDPGDRMTTAGYAWRGYGENIAAGQRSPSSVVESWRTSPGHCANMMGEFVHLGVGHAAVPGSRYGDYWVQVFGVPR